ncbi:hypothetical protein KSY34_11500 [Phocaeicola coprocola]|uniref:hypothetical protein n=1 Tax=Phocaeicola coprocola TaxID=310298 RepID=UPI001C37F90F|nr:hypothetical protein [Phocaeicola coprocola]MBV4008627.1 hypothetical protein [Phocaeicola coprocola]MBV4033150.1 hypothetical protein [Phocaeicola coprocola]MBV4039706.1 hypothetical protein [Phocaeicola coprocola]MBV4061367.1 hypothetical protein [Phocaeicola coprocola]
MADKQEKILDIKVNYSEAIKAIAEYQTKIDAAREAESKLKKQLKDGEISRQQYNEEMAASKAYIADCNDSIRIITKTMQNQIKQEKEQEGSLRSLRAQLSNLTAEYDALSEAERKGTRGEELKNYINEVTDALKGAEEETQRYYRNVGNYKEAIIDAANANIPFIQQINQMVTSLGGLKNYLAGMKTEMVAVSASTTGWIKVLKLLKVALIGTGIGALVVALGSLVAWFTKTQKGVEAANKIMAALGATINVIIDRASKLGSALVNLFTGNFKKAGEDAKAIFSGIGKEIADETKQAWELAEVLNEIDKKEVMLSMSRAANRAEIEKLKKAADDQTLSTQERIKAAEKAAEIEKKDLEIQTELAEARLANTLGYTEMNREVRKLMEQIKSGDITADEVIGKLGLSESTIEDLKTFRDQFNELQELMEDSYGRQTEQQNTLNSIRQEGADKAKEAKQKELEAVRAAEDAMLALVKDKREQARKEIELTYTRKIEDLRISLREEENLTVKARKAINEQIKSLEQQKNIELQKLSDEELQKEIDKRTKLISLQLESVKEGSEQEYQLRMQQLASQRDAELADKELTEQMKQAITAKYNKQMDDLAMQHEKDVSEKQQEAIRLRMENEIMQMQQSGASELEILQEQASQKLELLNNIQQQEGESEQEFLNRKLQAHQEYTDAKKELADKEVEIEQTKLEAIESVTGGLASAFEALGENNKAFAILSKTLALAEIAINTGKALAAGIAQSQSVPFPANIAAIATTVGAILANIATAINTVKSAKFATGGLVTGPGTGTSDSVPAQLSNGESVMTARATSMFAPILSSFNQMGGGVPINVAQSSNQSIGEDMLARAVAKGMLMAPAPQVSVEEFTSVANKVKFLESNGNL